MKLYRIRLPLTLGPEVLMGLALFVYLLGLITGSFEWDQTLQLVIIFTALILQIFVRCSFAFIPIILCVFYSLGNLSRSMEAPLKPREIYYFRLSNIKLYPNHIQAYGKLHVRKKSHLIPTKHLVVCTILKSPNHFKAFQSGDLIAACGEMRRIQSDKIPGSFDVETFYRSKGISYRCYIRDDATLVGQHPDWQDNVEHFRQQLSNIFDRDLAKGESGLAKALLLGDGSSVDSTSKAAFSATGAIHVLAVSGMHVALFAQILLLLLGLFHRFIQKRTIQIICIGILWYYAILTGLSPSVVRSVTMFTILQIAQFLGKESTQNHSVILCAFLMVVVDPNCVIDIGFQLSFLAVLGISNFQKRMENWITPKNKILRFLWSNTCVAMAAQSLTLPLTLYYFHTFPNYFLLANIGVAVISVMSMYLGFAYLFLCGVPYLGAICAIPFQYSLKALNRFLEIIASIPGAIAEGYVISITICILLLLSIALMFYTKIQWLIRCIPLTVLVIIITINRHHRQHEKHLYLLQGKTPLLIMKQGTSATVIMDKKQFNSSLNQICSSYRKIYALDRLDTLYLEDQDSIILPKLTLIRHKGKLSVNLKTLSHQTMHTFVWENKPQGWSTRKIMLN